MGISPQWKCLSLIQSWHCPGWSLQNRSAQQTFTFLLQDMSDLIAHTRSDLVRKESLKALKIIWESTEKAKKQCSHRAMQQGTIQSKDYSPVYHRHHRLCCIFHSFLPLGKGSRGSRAELRAGMASSLPHSGWLCSQGLSPSLCQHWHCQGHCSRAAPPRRCQPNTFSWSAPRRDHQGQEGLCLTKDWIKL